jgi:hypothetical protein
MRVPVIIENAAFLVCIMAVIARHIIGVIVTLLVNNITKQAQSVCALETCIFSGHGYLYAN